MPAKHKYKCLNPNCQGTLFIAMNAPTPECPRCGARKKEDWGPDNGPEGIYRSRDATFGRSGSLKQSDANLRRIADRYELTNISNKDGRAAKSAPQAPTGGPTMKIGGYDVPVSESAGCHRLPVTVPLTAKVNVAKTAHSGMVKSMTRVVAEHKS